MKEQPAVTGEADLQLLPRAIWSAEIKAGKLILSAWTRGEYRHYVRFDLLNPSDNCVSLDDLEGVLVDRVNMMAAAGA